MSFGSGWLAVRRVSLRPIVGALAEAVVLGLAIARIGDVLVADHLGRATTGILGYRLPETAVPNGGCAAAGDVCHPTALYELLFLVPLLVGSFLLRRRSRPESFVFGYLIGGYGVLRFAFVEPFRVTPRLLGLTGSQWACLALAGWGIALLLRGHRRRVAPHERDPASLGREPIAHQVPASLSP